MIEEYKLAKKLGQKQVKKALAANEFPYPVLLDEVLEDQKTEGEVHLGITDIPLSLVVGVKESSRSMAFSKDFLPLLDEDSEFAYKWCSLYRAQLDEGIRDAVKVYEYKNRFYVAEGNKRVSVLKYLKQPIIRAEITRILPERNNTDESRLYYDFVKFNKLTGLNSLLFSVPGSYDKLLHFLEKSWDDKWNDEEISHLAAVFHYFSQTYTEINKETKAEITGDAFLRFLDIFPYNEFKRGGSSSIENELKTMKNELTQDALAGNVEHVMEPEKVKKPIIRTPIVGALLMPSRKKVKAAFIYQESINSSGWVYFHEKGRLGVEKIFEDELETVCYENVMPGEETENVIIQAIEAGCTVIFTTTASMMQATMKAALKNPEIVFFNCSLNYPYRKVRTYQARVYEAKFLEGIIAGSIAETDAIAYEAYYPMYGEIANINAFSLGVQLVNPKAKIKLYWDWQKAKSDKEYEERIVSAKEENFLGNTEYRIGLFGKENGEILRYAAAIIDWEKFYEHILRLIIEGNWKKVAPKDAGTINYWWGFSAGVLKLLYSDNLPKGTKRLVENYKSFIAQGCFNPFEGVICDQNGEEHGKAGESFSVDEIVNMNWLCENVIGSIPTREELSKDAINHMGMLSLEGGRE